MSVQRGDVHAASVTGRWLTRASGKRERLAAPIHDTLIGTLTPAAVPSPSNPNRIAYNSGRRRRPVLRLHDLSSREDSVIAEGALSLAWRRDGALAYFQALERELKTPRTYLGHVVVRSSLDRPPRRWTDRPARYVAAAWARNTLIVYRIGRTWPDLLALDGPGRVRTLARASALVAVSPDGKRALVAPYGASPAAVRLLEIANGRELATLAFTKGRTVDGKLVRWVSETGSWSGDLVAVRANIGVVLLRIRGAEILLEGGLGLDTAGFSAGLAEPLLDRSARTIVGWAQLADRPREAFPNAAVLECERLALTCRMGRQVSSIPGVRLVYNPSRP